MLGKFALKQNTHGKDAVGIFFRSTREDLKEAVERSKDIYTPLGAKYVDRQWTFPGGARLKFEYLERDKDAQNYQGHSYTDLFFEELTNWASPDPINKLRATLRSATGVPCQLHATGNPGGPGHQWVKARYIDPCPTGGKMLWEEYKNPFTQKSVKMSRVFIPSKLSDNPTLMRDPGYVARLYQSGSAELVRAWLHGISLMAHFSIAGILTSTSSGHSTSLPIGSASGHVIGVRPSLSVSDGGRYVRSYTILLMVM